MVSDQPRKEDSPAAVAASTPHLFINQTERKERENKRERERERESLLAIRGVYVSTLPCPPNPESSAQISTDFAGDQ